MGILGDMMKKLICITLVFLTSFFLFSDEKVSEQDIEVFWNLAEIEITTSNDLIFSTDEEGVNAINSIPLIPDETTMSAKSDFYFICSVISRNIVNFSISASGPLLPDSVDPSNIPENTPYLNWKLYKTVNEVESVVLGENGYGSTLLYAHDPSQGAIMQSTTIPLRIETSNFLLLNQDYDYKTVITVEIREMGV